MKLSVGINLFTKTEEEYLFDGNFSSDPGVSLIRSNANFGLTAVGRQSCAKIYPDSQNGRHAVKCSNLSMTENDVVQIYFQYYLPSTHTNAKRVYLKEGNVGFSTLYQSSLADSWVSVSIVDTVRAGLLNYNIEITNSSGTGFQGLNDVNDDFIYLRNWVIRKL